MNVVIGTPTPGPWIIDQVDPKSKRDLHIDEHITAYWIAGPGDAGEVVATVEDPSPERARANADRIAATPDLFDACIATLDFLRHMEWTSHEAANGAHDLRVQIEQALAKAEGAR
jgi:hypothetical protein